MTERDHIIKLLQKASGDPNFLKRLKFFHEYDKKPLRRWENWLQMELLYWLHNSGVKDISFEDESSLDKRRIKSKSQPDTYSARIDIVYRRNNCINNVYTGIELKVKDNQCYSVRESLKDLEKISCISNRDWRYYSVFSISIYRFNNNQKYNRLFENEENSVIINLGPYYKAAILCWESSSKKYPSLKEYQYWLKQLNKFI